MAIVLLILKIIGITLLVLLLVIILVLLALLFVPLRYRVCLSIDGDSTENTGNSDYTGNGESDTARSNTIGSDDGRTDSDDGRQKRSVSVWARAFWLLHLIAAEIKYEDGQTDAFLRILFWRKELLNNEEVAEEEETVKEAAEKEETVEENAEEAANDIAEEAADDIAEEAVKPPKQPMPSEQKKESSKKTKSSTRKPKIAARLKKIFNDISILRKKITYVLEDELNKRAFSHLKINLIKILKAVMPRKLSMNLQFSMGSPDITGEVLGVCALFPVLYQPGNHLSPDFESDDAYAKGNINARGRIYLYQILFPVLGVVFDKNCKRLYRMLKKYFG